MAKKEATATIEETMEMKEFEELVTSLAPYKLDDETPSQTLERLLSDRKEFETELLQLKKTTPVFDIKGQFEKVKLNQSKADNLVSVCANINSEQNNRYSTGTKLDILANSIQEILNG